MRSKEDIWIESKEFLLKEYDACWAPLIDTYNRNESWFKFYITFLTLVVGIVGVTSKVGETNEYAWEVFCVFLFMLYVVGLATLRILYNNRKVIVEYINAINAIRKFFVHRAVENVEPAFRRYVLLPIDIRKYFLKGSVNLVMIYLVFLFNFLVLVGIFVIFIRKVDWIIRFGYGQPFSIVIFVFIIAFFITNLISLPWIVCGLSKRDRGDKELMEPECKSKGSKRSLKL